MKSTPFPNFLLCFYCVLQYLCLTHELSNGVLCSTSFKKRGAVGFKSSRYGATETITYDFVNLIFKGYFIVETGEFDAYKIISGADLKRGMKILHFNEEPIFDNMGHRINNPSLVSFSVTKIERFPSKEINKGEAVFVNLLDCATNQNKTMSLFLIQDYNMSHIFSTASVSLRHELFIKICKYRAFSIAMGALNWEHLIRRQKVQDTKNDFIKIRDQYDLITSGKQIKVPYLNLMKRTELGKILNKPTKTLTFSKYWEKQDPTMAMFRRYPFSLCLSTMENGFFGEFLKCEGRGFWDTFTERKFTKEDCHHIRVKNYIDRTFLNENLKFLVHTMINNSLFNKTFYNNKDPRGLNTYVREIVTEIIALKEEISRLQDAGSSLFYAINNNIPPELLPGVMDGTYIPQRDRALIPLRKNFSLPTDIYTNPENIYKNEIEKLKLLIPRVQHDKISFSEDFNFTHKTLTLVPKRIAADLNISGHIQRVTNYTDDQDVTAFARGIYVTTLFRHFIDREKFEYYEDPQCNTKLMEPPRCATPEKLKEWLLSLKTTLEDSPNKLQAHCSMCMQFWMTAFETPATFLQMYYRFDNGLFYRKAEAVCFM